MTRVRKIVLGLLMTPVVLVALLWIVVVYETHGPSVAPAKAGTVRVACVGDSITFGNPFSPGSRYPNQLEKMLGSGYSVRNFGAPGYTTQKSGDHPYWQHRYFRLSTEFAPDIVLLMIGSNDSKPQNWAGVDRFSTDYRALIAHYQALPTKPRIILMTPPSTFLNGRAALPGRIDGEIVATIAENVKQLGAELGLQVIDVHAMTAPHGEFFTWDGIHPDGDGQHLIAKAAFDLLSTAPAPLATPQT